MSQYTRSPAGETVTVDEFYDMIDESLNDSPDARQWPYYAMDYVASRQEWSNFKAAMERWMAKQDRESEEGFAQFEAEQREAALRLVPNEEA